MTQASGKSTPTVPDDKKPIPDENPPVAQEDEFLLGKSLAEKLASGEFDETDADDDPEERGWIVYRERLDDKGNSKEHRVPVQYWAQYSRIHNL